MSSLYTSARGQIEAAADGGESGGIFSLCRDAEAGALESRWANRRCRGSAPFAGRPHALSRRERELIKVPTSAADSPTRAL